MISSCYKILIVNSDVEVLSKLRLEFEGNGYTVVTSSTGAEVLEILKTESIDMVILDLHLPSIDGIELSVEIRKNKRSENVLIALLSERDEDYTRIAAYQAGVDSFILKPVRMRVLIEEIKVLFRRKSRLESPSSIIDLGDIKIDLEKRTVSNNERVLELTKKEFDLFVMLTSHPKKVFTREEAYRTVWGDKITAGDRTIDVYIRKLRSKLGSHTIQSVKGVGYKYIA